MMEKSGNNGGCFLKCFETNSNDPSSSLLSLGANTTINRMGYDVQQDEMKATEDFLASELNKLSVQERSKALDDLHCVGEDLTETSELIETSLREMDRILEERNDPIYEIAKRQNRAYVEDPNFRLRFLRANGHDPRKSAIQMIGLLSRKEIYFGRDKLARDITFDDLTEEDKDLLADGVFHIQDGTDRNGRLVVYLLNHTATNKVRAENMIRLNYFVFFNMLSHLESVQRKGIVVCFYDMSTAENPCHVSGLDEYLKYVDFTSKVPIRRSAMHFCIKAVSNLAPYNVVIGTALQGLQRSANTRTRVHIGSDIELQYKLRGHGIPSKTIPVDISGNIRRSILGVWFRKYATNEWDRIFASASHKPLSVVQKRPLAIFGEEHDHAGYNFLEHDVGYNSLEHVGYNSSNYNTNGQSAAPDPGHKRSPPAVERTIEPTATDVLLGRGKGPLLHPGNIRFRKFLTEYQEDYNNTPRYKRVKTHTELTRMLMKDGVRFLKMTKSGDGWVESNFSEAEKKVKQFFRSHKRKSST